MEQYGTGPGTARRLRALGALTQLALVGALLSDVVGLRAVWRQRSSLQDYVAAPDAVNSAAIAAADDAAVTAAHIELAALIVGGLVFIIWLYRARRNAQVFNPDIHRRGPGWAIGGWFVPVMNFWVPYQVMTDTLLACEEPTGWRRGYALIRAWWACWLVSMFGQRLLALQHPDTVAGFENHAVVAVALRVLAVVTAVLAILVVGRVTGANDRRRTVLLGTGGAGGFPVAV